MTYDDLASADVTFKKLSVSLPLSITWTDFPDKESCAVIVYFSGCKHGCSGCQNPGLQRFDSGSMLDWWEIKSMIEDECYKAKTKKVVLSGGDPYFQPREIEYIIIGLAAEDYEVCVYTGADIKSAMERVPYATYYKCGKYDEHNKEKEWGKFPDRMVFVSKNQRLYDKDGKQISVDNVYYFSKWETFKARIRKFLKRG